MESIKQIGKTIEPEFWSVVESVPAKVLKIQGIYDVDPFMLDDSYFESNVVADMSIDANANIGSKSPVNFTSEIFKPQLKLRSFHKIWLKLKGIWGLDQANEILYSLLDGTLYFHDITKIDVPYCFAFDTSFIATQGRPYGWLKGVPPKRSSSFMGQLIETTMDWSQELAGASN